jgi:pimeloyl-ACP methyl ester carboxylesterase
MDLFFRKYGTGYPLIILHGLFGMSDNWVSIGKKIADAGYCVYIPDQRNHGASPRSNDFNYEFLSSDLEEFILHENISTPVIIGHSMGGKAAMTYALKHPGKIKKLIIVDIGVKKYPIHDKEIIDAVCSINISTSTTRADIERELSLKINDYRIVQLMMKNLTRNENNSFEWKLNIKAIRENFSTVFENIPRNNSPYPGSTLFITGEKSFYIMENDIPGIHVLFPNSIFETIQNAGHWVHADNPNAFLEVVLHYLKN